MKSKTVAGHLICWGLREPISHFALEFNGAVILHSNFFGVHAESRASLFKISNVICSKEIPLTFQEESELLCSIMSKYYGAKYDWKWFFSLVKHAFLSRFFGRPIPSEIKSKSRDKFLCTECVTFLEPIIGKIDIGNGSPYLLAKRMGVI